MVTRRTVCVAVGTALVALATGGVASAADKLRVALAVPGFTPYAPVYAAQDLGIYKAKNLDVELTVYRGGPAAQEAVAAGAADILSFFPPGVALAIKKGVKEKIVAGAASVTPQGWHILVKADSPIKSLKDLAGKKIGITAKGATSDFYALWAGKMSGGEIQTIPLGGAGILPALKASQIDAAALWPNLSYRLIEGKEGRSLVDLGKEMPPNLPEVWVATDAMIAEKPDLVKRFLESIMKATAHMQKDEAYGVGYVKKYAEEKDDKVAKMAYDAIIKTARTDGKVEVEWLKNAYQLANLAGIADLPPIEQIWTDKFLPVKAE
ncbi:MAG: ABC transporter substrate-binding protein [Rhodospirillales bacterium]